MATFQFGGSIRVGFLPPRFSLEQVMNMPIQTLTAYPNKDLDPKNTGWTTFEASDERNILFHWMDDLESIDPQSFGGWFVFYVAAPLVVSGGSPSSVSLLVEAAGDFQFAQLKPVLEIDSGSNGWIPSGPSNNLMLHSGTDDQTSITHIQIIPNTETQMKVGYFLANAVGGNPMVRETPGGVMSTIVQQYADHWRDTNKPIATTYHGSFISSGSGSGFMNTDKTLMPALNGEITAIEGIMTGSDKNPGRSKYKKFFAAPGENPWDQPYGNDVAGTSTIVGTIIMYRGGDRPPINVPTTIIQEDTSTLPNILPNESLVTFVNLDVRTVNLQTRETREQISSIAKPDHNVSQLYQLFSDASPTPVLTLRLLPNGTFTTRGMDTPSLLQAKSIYLRYLQDLPVSTPLPPSLAEHKFLRTAARCTAKEYNTLKQWNTNLWRNF